MLVRRDGHDDFVKVLDFGLAQVSRHIASDSDEHQAQTAPKLTQVGEIFGTPAYMAPEQSVGGDIDIRTDLYAVGVILYEMLAGVRPFRGRSQLELIQAHLTTPPPPMKERAPKAKVSPALEVIVRRLLEKQSDDRFQSPTALLAAIDELAAAESISLPGIGALLRSSSHPALAPVRESTPTPMPTPVGSSSSEIAALGPSLAQRFSALRGLVLPIIQKVRSKIFRQETTGDKVKRALTSFGRLFQKKEKRRGLLQRGPLLGMVALIVMVAAGLAYVWWSGRGNDMPELPTSKPVAPKPLPPEQLAQTAAIDAATAQGTVALSTLASRFPADTRVLRALAKLQGGQREYVEAMQTLARIAAIDANTGREPELVRIIVAALQAGPEAIQAAAVLMEQDLGESGIDLLYDMTIKQTQARWKPRLNQSLTRPEVLARASTATRVALELRSAKTCEAKRDLLPRVTKEGGERALVQLRSLTSTSGCGFFKTSDCWPCLRRGTALRDAISTLEARAKSAP